MRTWLDNPDPAPDAEPVATLAAYQFRLADAPDMWHVMFGADGLDDALASVHHRFGERRVLEVRPLKVRREMSNDNDRR